MNNGRRKEIQSIVDQLEKLEELRDSLEDEVERIRDEEQEYLDNMPESFQGSDKGYAAEQAIGYLDEAVSILEDVNVDDLKSSLESAAE